VLLFQLLVVVFEQGAASFCRLTGGTAGNLMPTDSAVAGKPAAAIQAYCASNA
jgi:hypothetical protein